MTASSFYSCTIAFLSGVALRTLVPLGWPEVIWGLLLAAGVSFTLYLTPGGRYRRQQLLLCACVVCGVLGVVRFEIATYSEAPVYFENRIDQAVTVTGVVVREPDLREYTQHLYVAVADELVLVSTDRYDTYAYGDELTVTGTLMRPQSFTTDLGRTFNYPGYLKAQGVEYLIRYGDITKAASGSGNPVLATLLSFKQVFMETIEQIIPEPQVGLGEGLLLGVKRALGAELTEVFRRTGIIHIVVLSGYNVMLVVTFVTYILSYLLPLRGRLVFGLLAICAFAFLVGLSATVVRASIMASLLLIAQATGRTYAIVRALLLAAVVMVILNPYLLLYDPGFQLSFLATLGLILLGPVLEQRLTVVPTAIKIREFLVATIVTQIFVLPLLLYQIGEFSIVSVLVNVLVLPMVPVAMLLTFLTGVVGFVSTTLALPLAWLTTLSLSYILFVAEYFAELSFAAVSVPAFSFHWVVVAYIGLAGLVWWVSKRLQPYQPIATPQSHAATRADVRNWTIVVESDTEPTSVASPTVLR